MPVRAASCECGVKRRRKPGGEGSGGGGIICDARAVSMRNEKTTDGKKGERREQYCPTSRDDQAIAVVSSSSAPSSTSMGDPASDESQLLFFDELGCFIIVKVDERDIDTADSRALCSGPHFSRSASMRCSILSRMS